jgi:hypothetical protein
MNRATGRFLGNLKRIRTKGHRKRWTNSRGQVFEEDTLHGELEKYNDRGRHGGSVDPDTGELIKEAVRGRKTEV